MRRTSGPPEIGCVWHVHRPFVEALLDVGGRGLAEAVGKRLLTQGAVTAAPLGAAGLHLLLEGQIEEAPGDVVHLLDELAGDAVSLHDQEADLLTGPTDLGGHVGPAFGKTGEERRDVDEGDGAKGHRAMRPQSLGRPSTRSPRMLRRISEVPARMPLPRAR